MAKLQMNKQLVPIKAHYFFFYGALSGVIPILSVYAKEIGISASTAGVIFAIFSFSTLITKPAFGGIADYFQKLKEMLILLILVTIISNLGLRFIPPRSQVSENTTSIKLFCYNGSSYLVSYDSQICEQSFSNSSLECPLSCSRCQEKSVYCSDNITEPGTVYSGYFKHSLPVMNVSLNFLQRLFEKCLQVDEENCNESCFEANKHCETNPTLQLWLFCAFFGIFHVANGSIISLTDAACYNALDSEPELFGKQRMWGALGWGFFALLSGYLNHLFTDTSDSYNFAPGFYVLSVLFAIDLLVINRVVISNVKLSRNICKDISQLVTKSRTVIFLIVTFCVGASVGISKFYLFWYLRTNLEASQLILGCLSGVQCFLGEVPCFFFSGWVIKKMGHINTFTMSLITYGLKFLIHSFLLNPWLALPVEILQGPSYGCFYAAMTSYANQIAPDGTDATMQGIASGTYEGLGQAAGSLLGGFALNYLGGRKTIFWSGIISLLAGLLHFTVNALIGCKRTDDKEDSEKLIEEP